MPKRKRAHNVRKELDPTQEIELKKAGLAKKLVHGKKVLHRALKTAKGFERQKLGRRIKLATEKQDGVEAGRLQRELDVLKVRHS
jgi:BUD22